MKNIIGNNKRSNPLLAHNYSIQLLNEYMASRGVNVVNLESSFAIEDVERFIKERKRSNNLYARYLDGLTIDYHDSDTIENIDCREFLISNTCDFDTTVLSSDRRIYHDVRSDRIILGNIKIFNGVPTIAHRVKDGYHYQLLNGNLYKTIMKTNPRIDGIKYFGRLKQISNFNLIVGINGNNFDFDKDNKFKAMNELSNELGNDVIRFQYSNEDDYLYLIASKSLKRIK